MKKKQTNVQKSNNLIKGKQIDFFEGVEPEETPTPVVNYLNDKLDIPIHKPRTQIL